MRKKNILSNIKLLLVTNPLKRMIIFHIVADFYTVLQLGECQRSFPSLVSAVRKDAEKLPFSCFRGDTRSTVFSSGLVIVLMVW